MRTPARTDANLPRPPASRRFSLLDAMILVASTAVGLGLVRAVLSLDESGHYFQGLNLIIPWDRVSFAWRATDLALLVIPPALAMTLGVLAIRLRRPRPRWRRLARQPGFVAGLILVLVGGVSAVFGLTNENEEPLTPSLTVLYGLYRFAKADAFLGGFAVAVAWTAQLLVGRWRAEASWIDRLGRVVGVAWIVLFLAAWYGFPDLF